MERLSRFKGKLGVGATNMVACMVSIAMFFVLMFSSGLPHAETKREFVDGGDSRGILRSSAMDTGASSASRDYKGGIIFLEPNTQYTMKGGTYSGGNKTYGGAVYISEGATFTMDGGTITNCKATYGGGIYVRAGATCNILSGSITGCSATYGPAIFVEDGGILNIEDGVDIDENDIMIDKTFVSSDLIQVGDTSSETYMQYVEFGSYPQTYVGNALNAELETWFNTTNPQAVATYETATKNPSKSFLGKGKDDDVAYGAMDSWEFFIPSTPRNPIFIGYEHEGEIYARGQSEDDISSVATFKDGTAVQENTIYWFRVEPIKWAVLNYDEWMAGAKLKLMSMISLGGGKQNSTIEGSSSYEWATNHARSWLNNEFYNSAFTEEERKNISLTTLENDIMTAGFQPGGAGQTTEDYVYILNQEEIADTDIFASDHSRICSPSDFAIALDNSLSSKGAYSYNTYWIFDTDVATSYRQGVAAYMLRGGLACGTVSGCVRVVGYDGKLYESHPQGTYLVRPFITLSI